MISSRRQIGRGRRPFWFVGPDFQQKHEIRPPATFDPHGYSDNFLTYTADFNADGWLDVFCVPFPGAEGFWYENPKGKAEHWGRHLAYPIVGNESPGWVDMNGDGRPDLIFNNKGFLGCATYDPAKPNEPWTFHEVTPKANRFQSFTHGIGAGDNNGNGKTDLIEAVGWWEQPMDGDTSKPWKFHAYKLAEAASQMLMTDVDGDGLLDVITSWHCHQYGLVWHRQIREATDGRSSERGDTLSGKNNLVTGQVYAKPGEIYSIYVPVGQQTGTLNLAGVCGKFSQRWYNPRTGEFAATAKTIEGNPLVALGNAAHRRGGRLGRFNQTHQVKS